MGPSAAFAAADMLYDLDLAGRRNLVRNMFMNNLAAYAGLKRAHATNAGVWLIKHSTITKFHDMCRDKGITVNEEVGNAERP